MNKFFRLTSNGLLLMFLLGVLIVPIASMGFMGVKAKPSNVLSAQDSKVKDLRIEELERENEYLRMQINNQAPESAPATISAPENIQP